MSLLILIFSGIIMIAVLNLTVINFGKKHTTPPEDAPEAQTAIVLGALVYPGHVPCTMLKDRILTAVDLYKAGKVKRILMTGDHGRPDYDEVNTMRVVAMKAGVPSEDIFMDHAGFCTYESMYRAKNIFKVKSAIVVTQKFHLSRSVYIARKLGIDATGVEADRTQYIKFYLRSSQTREIPARVKDFLMVNIVKPKPTYLGDEIPIMGNASDTHDGGTVMR